MTAPDAPPTEPWKAPEFFADAMRDHGRCWCSVDGPCIPGKSCDLCESLPADWPCPTIDHAGYPLPVVTVGPAEAAEPLRTPELDAAFRLNDTDPDQLDDEEYALLTQPTDGDYGSVPNPAEAAEPATTGHMLAPGVPCFGCQICLVSDCERCAVGESCAEHDPTGDELTAQPELMHCGCGRALPCRHCPPGGTVRTDWLSETGIAITRAKSGAPESGPHLVGADTPAMLKLLRRVQEGMWTAAEAQDVLLDWPNRAGSVTTTPPAPGYQRIADAINAACEAGDIDLTVVHDGRVLDYVPGVVWLATVLDKAGLIDWSAFQDETPVEPALIGTWADPAFVAHQNHKHPVDGCGYCPTDFEETT